MKHEMNEMFVSGIHTHFDSLIKSLLFYCEREGSRLKVEMKNCNSDQNHMEPGVTDTRIKSSTFLENNFSPRYYPFKTTCCTVSSLKNCIHF